MTYYFLSKSFLRKTNKKNMQRRFWDVDINLLHYALKMKNMGIFKI
jgi:hypothetical protein